MVSVARAKWRMSLTRPGMAPPGSIGSMRASAQLHSTSLLRARRVLVLGSYRPTLVVMSFLSSAARLSLPPRYYVVLILRFPTSKARSALFWMTALRLIVKNGALSLRGRARGFVSTSLHPLHLSGAARRVL
ncbi:hypothetical protein LZ30DRAFT_73575 [Colletotrichum cereale]|nr:hypothetical protein LZ30DRAFT_73575 [Colletotrichum cereale]